MDPKTILEKLLEIQRELKVEKGTFNEFGNFYYRSKEDVLEAVKPLCHERGLVIVCTDEVQLVDGGWVYIKVTASLTDAGTGESVSSESVAREPESKAKMDASQVTGSAASYAGKRALGNLFAIDDTKDADTFDNSVRQPPEEGPFNAKCTACGVVYAFRDRSQLEQSACQCGNRKFEVV